MSGVLFLTQRMTMGYGVDLAVHEVSQRLASAGISVTVLCNEADATYRGRYDLVELERGTPGEVQSIVESRSPRAVVACASPFLEMLPGLQKLSASWAWEYGEPTPELFGRDAAERRTVKRLKTESCYPAIAGTLAISEFIRSDIEWPEAHVAYLGCDHVPDLGSKGLEDFGLSRARPLRVGTLMRLGRGEARYKGNRLFRRFVDRLSEGGRRFEFAVMGRGDERDAAEFTRAGFDVSLNATDREKWHFLRGLDVFVSCSLWEGFDLPLVEAQATGTLAVALDTGAHPEVCPLIFSNVEEMAGFVSAISSSPSLLVQHSRAGYHFVRRSFRWHETTSRFREIVLDDTTVAEMAPQSEALAPTGRGSRSTLARNVWATLRSLQLYGLSVTLQKIRRRIGESFRTGAR